MMESKEKAKALAVMEAAALKVLYAVNHGTYVSVEEMAAALTILEHLNKL